MDEDHYITWVYLETTRGGSLRVLKPGDQPQVEFRLSDGERPLAVYEYCNRHGALERRSWPRSRKSSRLPLQGDRAFVVRHKDVAAIIFLPFALIQPFASGDVAVFRMPQHQIGDLHGLGQFAGVLDGAVVFS